MTSITGDEYHQTSNRSEEDDVLLLSVASLTSWISSMASKVVVELGVVEIMKREAEVNGGWIHVAGGDCLPPSHHQRGGGNHA